MEITRETVMDAVIEVVEAGMIESAPKNMPQEEIDKVLAEQRPGLLIVAGKIADKVFNA